MAQIMSKFHLAFGVAEPPQGDDLYASPAEAFLLLVCVVAGFAPCRVAIPMG